MKQAYLIFLLILFTAICSAQKLSDKFEYKVTYKLTYKLDSTNLDESKSEYMILFAGDELSKFSSRAKLWPILLLEKEILYILPEKRLQIFNMLF